MNIREARRKGIIDAIRSTIVKSSKDNLKVPEENLIARFCLETGHSRRTIREYLSVLINAGVIIRDNGKLFTSDMIKNENGGLT